MKPAFVSVLALLLLGACSSESSLPTPSGKGTLRALNAISGAPTFNFLIEERSAGTVAYKEASSPVRFDDFQYNFGFEVVLAGQSRATRVASLPVKIEKDREFTFIITGAYASPDIVLVEKPVRDFGAAPSVFEVRVGHFASNYPSVDVYLAAEGVVPVLGEQVATLAYGQVQPERDFDEGDYVVTVTSAGNPGDVIFQSGVVSFGAGNSILVGAFAPTGNDTDPLSIIGFTADGGRSIIADASSTSTIRLVHSALDLGDVDVYNDDGLTDLIAGGVMHTGISGDIPIATGDNDINVTPAGSTASLLVEHNVNVPQGGRVLTVIAGANGNYGATSYTPDRTSIDTQVKISLFNGASNHEVVDLYAVPAGTALEADTLARAAGIGTGFRSNTAVIQSAGSYDFYATNFTEKTVVGGPVTIDVELGDIVNLILFDTVDPNLGNLQEIPPP